MTFFIENVAIQAVVNATFNWNIKNIMSKLRKMIQV